LHAMPPVMPIVDNSLRLLLLDEINQELKTGM
jgi:hypothetical protein